MTVNISTCTYYWQITTQTEERRLIVIHGYMDNRRVFSASQHTKVQAFSTDSISIYTLLNNTTMITVIARVIKDAPIGNWANGPSGVFGLEVPDEFPKSS